jgi:hypothetical protein
MYWGTTTNVIFFDKTQNQAGPWTAKQVRAKKELQNEPCPSVVSGVRAIAK